MNQAGEDEWSPTRVFEAIDSDGSGTIDTDELSLAMSAVLGKAVSENEVEKFMKLYDSNNDGVLDLMEFTKFVSEVGKKKSSKMNLMAFRGKESKEKVKKSRAAVKALEKMDANGCMVGMHIGTSHSKCAMYDPPSDSIVFFKDKELSAGQEEFPSVVYLAKEGSTTVGQSALVRAIQQRTAWNCVTGIKRMIGEDFDIENMKDQQAKLQIPTEIVKVETDFQSNVVHKLNYGGFRIPDFKITGSQFPPEEIMSLVMRNARRLVEKNIPHECKECVLTVPAHWMGHKRRSFLLSSTTSGYKTNLLNATTAVALGFWVEHAKTKEGSKRIAAMKKGAKTPTLVFYAGGGYFDVAVINIAAKSDGKLYYKTQCAAGGDAGGEDMTSAITEYVCSKKLERKEDGDSQGRDRRSSVFVDTITEHLENLGGIIKESFGVKEDDGLGAALASTPVSGDPNDPTNVPSGKEATPLTRKDKYRGSRPSPIKNNVGLFVAEAQRIRAIVEKAKRQLSIKTEIDLNIDGFVPFTLTRDEIENCCEGVCSQMQSTVKSLLEENKINPKVLSQVIVAGGTSLAPQVRHYLKFIVGAGVPDPSESTIPVTKMACTGAAYHAAKLNGSLISSATSNYAIEEVLPREIVFADSWKQDDVTKGKGFHKFAPYGSKKTLNFYTTSALQTFLDVYINEKGLPFSSGTVDVMNVPALHEGSDVNVTFTVDSNGLLKAEAIFVDLSFSLKLKTEVKYLRSFEEEHTVQKRLDTQAELNTYFYERDKVRDELVSYCERTIAIVKGPKLEGKIRIVDRDLIIKTCNEVLKWIDNDGNLATRKAKFLSLETRRVEGYKYIYVTKMRETKEICAPILDAIVAIAAKSTLEKGDFCVAKAKEVKVKQKHMGYIPPEKKKKLKLEEEKGPANAGAEKQNHEELHLAMVVDKKHVVFFDDLNDTEVKISQIEHAFPADVEKSRNRYQACIEQLNDLRKNDNLGELIAEVFKEAVEQFIVVPAEEERSVTAQENKRKSEEVKEVAGMFGMEVKSEEDHLEEMEKEKGKEGNDEGGEMPELKYSKDSPEGLGLLQGLISLIPCLEEEKNIKVWLLDQMSKLCKEADKDESGGISVGECTDLFNSLVNMSLEVMHKRVSKIRNVGPPLKGDLVMAEVFGEGTQGEVMCDFVQGNEVIRFGDASNTVVKTLSMRKANSLDFERAAEKYAGFTKKLEELDKVSAREVWNQAFMHVMEKQGLLDEAGKPPSDKKTLRYDAALTSGKNAEEGKHFMEFLLRYFEFFEGESVKLSEIKSKWVSACTEADEDQSGDIDGKEGMRVWKNMLHEVRMRTNRQLEKLIDWNRRENQTPESHVIAGVLKAAAKAK